MLTAIVTTKPVALPVAGWARTHAADNSAA